MNDYDKYGELYIKQLELERKYHCLGMEQLQKYYDKAAAEGTESETGLGQKFINWQYNEVLEAVSEWLQDTLKPRKGIKPAYYRTLQTLVNIYGGNVTEVSHLLAFATLSHLIDCMGNGHKDLIKNNIGQQIARTVTDEAALIKYFSEHKDDIKYVEAGIDQRVQATYRRAYVSALMKHAGFEQPQLPKFEMQQLCVCVVCIVIANTPYFEDDYYNSQKAVKPSQALLDSWKKNEDNIILNAYRVCPTIIPPKDWEDMETGGYYGELQSVATLLRLHDKRSSFSRNYLSKLNQVDISKVCQAINGIQGTAWRIDKRVLEIVKSLIDLGGGQAGIPYIDAPPKPAMLRDNPTDEEVAVYKKAMVKYYKNEKRRQSIALRAILNTKIATEFAKYDRIYFPHNMDFRGRVYPIPSFSPQGDDLTKGLLLFADVPPCKSYEDIKWLMVHIANCAGVDKVSYSDRRQWVLDNEQNILSSAADPLGYNWWMDQDCPVQFLACCFEWANWKKHEAAYGTPKGFVTGMPIAFDGTCSGLQHYSAALRDPVGGKAVNLIPADKPSDIYGIVAAKVNEVLKVNAVKGTPDEDTTDRQGNPRIKYGTKTLAQTWLNFGVTRKVTKRSVMTLAYGSKEYGFKEQLLSDIIGADMNEGGMTFTDSNKWGCAIYMAKLIWEAVNSTVVKAVEGMKWLQTCAKKVTKEGQVVTWTTPMGLPVQQSYMELEGTQVQLRCLGKRIRVYGIKMTGNIDKASQASGIAPNFIHSMDASHLQLTTVNCMSEGIRHFAMIHDSYAVPASQASILYKVVRESFIQMYTDNDIFENFRADLSKLTTEELPPCPSKGDLDITQVMASAYIFS